MADWLTERVQVTPQRLALIFGEQRWTYAALDRLVDGVSVRLQAAGLKSGQKVAALMTNSPSYVAVVHAAARLGLVLVPLNTRLTPAELTWQLNHVASSHLLLDAAMLPKAQHLALSSSDTLLIDDSWLIPTAQLTINHSPFTINNFQSLVFTSGTSGHPKAVPLTFANHFWSATASAYRLGVQPDDLWLSVLPLYHVGGLAVLFRSCLYGTAVDLHSRFDLEAINRALDDKPITLISLVPTMLHRLLQTRRHWPASLRLILLGGAAADPALVARANGLPRAANRRSMEVKRESSVVSRRSSIELTNDEQRTANNDLQTMYNDPSLITDYCPPPLVAPTYGLTEAASQVATMPPEEAARKPGAVGKPLLFTQLKIVDEEGAELPAGAYGEIVVIGPTVMGGYLEEGLVVSTAAELMPAHTIRTGDIGYIDEDGDLWLVQRRSDLIVSGGENVYPAEVEAVLREHPAVSAVCVVGVADPEWGQRVVAMVVPQPETAVRAGQLLDHCRKQLAGYKRPRDLRLVPQLPLTASGKVHRRRVQEMMQAS